MRTAVDIEKGVRSLCTTARVIEAAVFGARSGWTIDIDGAVHDVEVDVGVLDDSGGTTIVVDFCFVATKEADVATFCLCGTPIFSTSGARHRGRNVVRVSASV